MKTQETGYIKNNPPKNNTPDQYQTHGPENPQEWLRWVDHITRRHTHETTTEFITKCSSEGLKITYPQTFIKIYYERTTK